MKIKIDLIAGIMLFFSSVIALLFPIFNINSVTFLLKYLFLAYSIINLARFLINKNSKDFEGLYTSIISIILFISLYFVQIKNSSLILALIIFAFVICESFIRLKKADYYHDRKEKIWILEITTLIVFIISGLLASLNILLTIDGNLFIIGYLFFINGFIEVIDPIVNYIKK